MSKQNSYGEDLLKGLVPAIDIPQIGAVYRTTTQLLGAKLTDLIVKTFDIPELDQIIFTPKIAKTNTGAEEISACAYFITQNNGNVFRRGKGGGASKDSNGRINMVTTSGAGGNSKNGPFGTSTHFNRHIGPFCKQNDNGDYIIKLKSVDGYPNVAALELDFDAICYLALGINRNSSYDFRVVQVIPIPQTTNYTIVLMKYIVSGGGQRVGRNNINYARIEQDNFRRINSAGNGGRQY